MHTSYSALDTYKTCPLKYKYQEIDKLKSPKRIEQVFGTVVHSTLRQLFERNPLYPTLDELVNFYRDKWTSSAEKLDVSDDEQKLYFEEGLKMIQAFYKKNKPWQYNTVEMESRFSMKLEDDNNSEHSVAGIIDRLDKDPDTDEYEIIDYKTGKRMPSMDMLEDNLQLGIYALSIKDRWPQVKPESIKTSLYFLKHGEKISTTHSEEKLERAKRRVLAIISEIEKRIVSGDFQPTPGPLCNWCSFRQICPMWSHEYKKDTEAPDESVVSEAIKEFFVIKESDDKNKKRLTELKFIINQYMDSKRLQRVFGGDGYITRSTQERFSFNMEKVQPILEKIGKWVGILSPDAKKLEKLLNELTEKERGQLLDTREKKSYTILKQTKKK